MKNFIIVISFLIIAQIGVAQELNCKVVVNADQIVGANPQVFKTMQNTISEFMNQRIWTNKTYKNYEKIDCSIIITLASQTGNDVYSGSIQVQSSRPVFNSVYNSPILNYKDDDLMFDYVEFAPLHYDENSYQSELVSTLSYFAYMIIGLDADTFELNGGDSYFRIAQKIVDQVEDPNNKKAWKSNTNKFNRYQFLNTLLSPSFKNYHLLLYNYHLKGLDFLANDNISGKLSIKNALMELQDIESGNMNAQIIRTFMDAKADEIVNIFSENTIQGSNVELKNMLNKVAPTSATLWEKIK